MYGERGGARKRVARGLRLHLELTTFSPKYSTTTATITTTTTAAAAAAACLRLAHEDSECHGKNITDHISKNISATKAEGRRKDDLTLPVLNGAGGIGTP